MIDMFQALEASDKYKSSMEKVGKGIGERSSNMLLDKLYFLELSLFSFVTGNNDMHLKNFSMILEDKKNWILSPAYDLLNVAIINPDDKEELALTLEGKKKKLKRENFENLAKVLDLTEKQVEGVFKRFAKNKAVANEWISNSFLSDDSKRKYTELLEERYARI